MHSANEQGGETTVAGVVRERWGVEVGGGTPGRFGEAGWEYGEEVGARCPACAGVLHTLRKPYESGGRSYRYTALVCAGCPAALTLAALGLKTYDQLEGVQKAPKAARSAGPGPRPGAAASFAHPAPRRAPWPADLPEPDSAEPRALLWCKVTDPGWRLPEAAVAGADDVRVIMPESDAYGPLREWLDAHGVPYRAGHHWEEAELVGTVGDLGGRTDLVVRPRGAVGDDVVEAPVPVPGPQAAAARDAFAAQWDALAELPADNGYVPVAELVPQEWAELLPYPTFNPAQAAAVPQVLDGDGHLVVVAPTGAGKTPVGMVAALDAHGRGRKAAWLVPQRSLTDELDRELELWRRHGMRVVRLTGEAAVDTELIRTADVWVATTEKFEAICRAGSLRDALAEVGCLVVDEIHLLGDPTRGAVLEALLARVRDEGSGVRIVGLSATVANAEEVTEWLGAQLIRTQWRPARLTWQLPVLEMAEGAGWAERAEVRTTTAVRLTAQVTAEGGSVLVFCGSKRRVRSTALALAADRGVPVDAVDADDTEAVERVCTKAGVRLHYRDWPAKKESERAFRAREADVLVATSTVAAGVNLPARAVIVSDTTVGLDRIEVSMVQQMFGRAGRVGAGEREGWAFLLADDGERPHWQARLAAGYTVRSQLREHLSDHLLAEGVQGTVTTVAEAAQWWAGTLAAHQGQNGGEPLVETIRFLAAAGYLRMDGGEDPDVPPGLAPSALGLLTSRFMVDAVLAEEVAATVRELHVPDSAEAAERALASVLATRLPVLEQAPFTDRARTALRRVLRELDEPDADDAETGSENPGAAKPEPGDLARAVLLAAAFRPHLFRGRPSYVLGIPADSMNGILEEAQRYLAWLGAQGRIGTAHPWAAIAAGDLALRLRWRALGPERGSGRLLWMCERMATAPHAPQLVPQMWRAARDRGIDAPDWPGTKAPTGCVLSPDQYASLLAERAMSVRFSQPEGVQGPVEVDAPAGSVVRVWNGAHTVSQPGTGGRVVLRAPTAPGSGPYGTAVFTRGDHAADGWLAVYRAAGAGS